MNLATRPKRPLCRYCAGWVADLRRICERCDDTRRVLRLHRRRVPATSVHELAKTYGCSQQRVRDLIGDGDD